MRTPILAAVVVTAAIAGAVLAMGPSNASACNAEAAAEVCITEPNTSRTAITGPIIHVTVEDTGAPIVEVDIYGPVIVIGPGDEFMPPVINITTDGR